MRGYLFAKLLKSFLALSNGCESWWSCSWGHYEPEEYLTCSFGHASHLVMNFLYLRSYMLKLFAFCLDSCIVNKGEKFVHVLGTWEHFEGVPIGSSKFWAVWCRAVKGRSNAPQAVRCLVGNLTAQCRRSNPPRQSEQVFALCCIPMVHCCIGSRGVWFGPGGACICAGGALCVVRPLDWWFALFAWAWFCLGCVELLPLPKGSKTCLLQVILLYAFLWLSIAWWGFLY
jgi:hypothetical protein